MGNDQTIAFCGAAGGQFQLNIMMPVMGTTALESVRLLASATQAFVDFCAVEMEANRRSLRGGRRKEPGDGHQPESATSATSGRRAGQGGVQDRQDDPRSLCQEQKILPGQGARRRRSIRWRMTEPH